jgi:hypothetical protein
VPIFAGILISRFHSRCKGAVQDLAADAQAVFAELDLLVAHHTPDNRRPTAHSSTL